MYDTACTEGRVLAMSEYCGRTSISSMCTVLVYICHYMSNDDCSTHHNNYHEKADFDNMYVEQKHMLHLETAHCFFTVLGCQLRQQGSFTWSLFSSHVLIILECTKHTNLAADLTELCWTELATFQQPLQPRQLCGEVVRPLNIMRGKLTTCCEYITSCKVSCKTDKVTVCKPQHDA